ncbi:ATP synthase subunit delta [Gammaproteobacteria bacterium]
MSDKITIARPYARAVFEQAQREDALESWSEMLTLAAHVVEDPVISGLLDNPLIGRDQIAGMIFGVVGEHFSEQGRNLIRVLAMNDRIVVLPEIAALFDAQKSEVENKLEAEVVSAYPMNDTQEQILTQALGKRFGRTVKITTRVDQNLIGGVIVRAGDVVIDGSLRAGLAQMASELRV